MSQTFSLSLFFLLWLAILAQTKITIIAHRGSSGERPEETFGAYARAAQVGADFLECDLCPTKDGHLILIHDCELSDTTNIGSLSQFANRSAYSNYFNKTGFWTENFLLSEIKTIRCVQRLSFRPQGFNLLYSVITLEEYLALVWSLSDEAGRGFGVYIETKYPAHFRAIGLPMEEHLAKALAKYKNEGGQTSCKQNPSLCRVILQSFDASSLVRLHELLPSIPRIYLTYGSETSSSLISQMANIATFATGLGPNMVSLTPELIASAHKHNLVVHPYTLRKETQFLPKGQTFEQTLDQWIQMGIDGVFTDNPGLAVAHLDSKVTTNYFTWLLPICGTTLALFFVQLMLLVMAFPRGKGFSPIEPATHLLIEKSNLI